MVRAGLEALVREDSRFQLVYSSSNNTRVPHSREATSGNTADVVLAESDLESVARVITTAAGAPIVLITDEVRPC